MEAEAAGSLETVCRAGPSDGSSGGGHQSMSAAASSSL